MLELYYFNKCKVHEWSLWFTKFLDLVPSFSKVHGWTLWFALCNAFSYQLFFQKYIDGPCGLHFITHLVPNLEMLKPLDLLVGN
ncbi:hypothetical protein Hanom_Chr03g00257161 [Helianthus anomalus]